MSRQITSNKRFLAGAATTGYTLIELILYMSIVGSLLTAMTLYFGTSTDARIKSQSVVEVNHQGSLAMDAITQKIRNASSITSPTAGNSAASLTLAMPAGVDNPTVFDAPSTALRINKAGAGAVALTNSLVQISSLSFTNLTRSGTPGVVRVSFTISMVNTSGSNNYDYQKTFYASAALRK